MLMICYDCNKNINVATVHPNTIYSCDCCMIEAGYLTT